MKIMVDSWGKRDERKEVSIAEAVKDSLISVFSDDTLRRLQEQLEKQAEAIGNLTEALHGAGRLHKDTIAKLLDYGYTIED